MLSRQAIGIPGDGSIHPPDSRVWLSFDGGASISAETAAVTRAKSGISNLGPLANVANVVWQISTTRAGFTSATVTLKYTDSEISGISESGLTMFQAPTLAGPWTSLPTSVNASANQASATVSGFSFFALGNGVSRVDSWELY